MRTAIGLFLGAGALVAFGYGCAAETGRTSERLIDGPTQCSAADPSCYLSHDYPVATDLTASNSLGVQYNAGLGGITIAPLPPPGTPWNQDSDSDGVMDVADDYPTNPALTGIEGGIYVILPYAGVAQIFSIMHTTARRDPDVYFLIDTTNSMQTELTNLKASLTTGTFVDPSACPAGVGTGVVGAIECAFPAAWFGVGHFEDYPVDPYGDIDGAAFYHSLDMGSNDAAARTAINALVTQDRNEDWFESTTQALFAISTASGLGALPARTCPAGQFGYPCFRDIATHVPIAMIFSDAPFHNGPDVAFNYDDARFMPDPSLPTPTAVSGNESQATAYDVGDVATRWVGFSGTTTGMVNDYSSHGCGTRSAPEAVFRFTVSATSLIYMYTDTSALDTTLSLRDSTFTTIIECDNDSFPPPNGNQARIARVLTPGTYYLIVDGWKDLSGAYRVSIGNPCQPLGALCPVPWNRVSPELVASQMKAISVLSCRGGGGASDTYCDDTVQDATDLANLTGSIDAAGNPLVYEISPTGTGITTAIVDAVSALVNQTRVDVSVEAIDNAGTAAVNEALFTKVASSNGCGEPPEHCIGSCFATNPVTGCIPNTTIQFDIAFQNDFVIPDPDVAQVFNYTMLVLRNGTLIRQTIPVRVVVPPMPAIFPASGSYWRDYDSTAACTGTEDPDWGLLTFTASTPAGTSIRFDVTAAGTLAGLPSAPAYSFTVPSTASPVDIGPLLADTQGLPFARVTATLLTDPMQQYSPTLSGFELVFHCVPGE